MHLLSNTSIWRRRQITNVKMNWYHTMTVSTNICTSTGTLLCWTSTRLSCLWRVSHGVNSWRKCWPRLWKSTKRRERHIIYGTFTSWTIFCTTTVGLRKYQGKIFMCILSIVQVSTATNLLIKTVFICIFTQEQKKHRC